MASKNLTRKDLSKKIYQTIGFSKSFSLSIVDDFFNILVDELRRSNKVKISSFGTFKIINKKERVGRNPKTKIETMITARKVVKFKPSDIMKEKLNPR